MNYPRVQFELINRDNGTSILLNDVTPGGTYYEPPKGWDESDVTIKRSMDYYGVFTLISSEFEFVTQGANFLRAAYATRDIEAKVDMLEYRFDPNTDVRYLNSTQTFDFSTYFSDRTSVSIAFKSGGLNATIESKQEEEVELERLVSLNGIDIDPVVKTDVALVNKNIFRVTQLETKEEDSLTTSFRLDIPFVTFVEAHVGIPLTINYESDDMITNQIRDQATSSQTEGLASMVFYLNNDVQKDLSIKFDLTFTGQYIDVARIENDAFFRVIIETYENGLDLDVVPSKRRTLFEVLGDANVVSYFFNETTTTLSFDDIITLEEGESLSLQWYGGGTGDDIGVYNVDFKDVSCVMDIEEDSQVQNTQSQTVLMKDAGEKLLQIMTGQKGLYESDFFTNGDFKLCGLTLGLWIRRFFDRKMTISWEQFIKNANALFLMGYTIENISGEEKIIHEHIDYFFQDFISVDITEKVSQITRSPWIEGSHSSIKMGYKKPSGDNLYEEAQGLDEPNGLNTFNTPLERVDTVYDQTSDFRADSYGKSFASLKPIETNPTDDTRYDKSIFVLDCKETEGELIQERNWEGDFEQPPSNVYDPENTTGLRITPLNNLLRHGKFIRSFTNKFLNDSISFTSSTVNNELMTTQPVGGVERAENSSVLVNDLDFPIFVNQVIEFKYKIDFPVRQQLFGKTLVGERLVQNFFGKVRFINDEGQKEEGYILEVGLNNEGTWKLLKSA